MSRYLDLEKSAAEKRRALDDARRRDDHAPDGEGGAESRFAALDRAMAEATRRHDAESALSEAERARLAGLRGEIAELE
ncbi:MAG: hypothetical protein HQL41_15550, partial [Alphaproteobacteria bacterium]|nr:hypothetical protein [Alphaproteobacteria bacterium]